LLSYASEAEDAAVETFPELQHLHDTVILFFLFIVKCSESFFLTHDIAIIITCNNYLPNALAAFSLSHKMSWTPCRSQSSTKVHHEKLSLMSDILNTVRDTMLDTVEVRQETTSCLSVGSMNSHPGW